MTSQNVWKCPTDGAVRTYRPGDDVGKAREIGDFALKTRYFQSPPTAQTKSRDAQEPTVGRE